MRLVREYDLHFIIIKMVKLVNLTFVTAALLFSGATVLAASDDDVAADSDLAEGLYSQQESDLMDV